MSRLPVLVYINGKDSTENVFFIIACSLVAGETMCPQSCSLVTAAVLSPVYTAICLLVTIYNFLQHLCIK
jgi:hypothetical protein